MGVDRRSWRELHHPVGEREQPLVVGCDDHDPAGSREVSQQPDHRVDLHVVEMRRRLVGEDHGRIERQGTRDRDALLLSSGQITRTVVGAIHEVDLCEHLVGARSRGASVHTRTPQRDDDVLAR